MSKYRARSIILICSLITAGSLIFSSFAQSAPEFRKRNLSVTVKDGENAISGLEVKVEQTRHHFGFGAAMAYWPMDEDMMVDQYTNAYKNENDDDNAINALKDLLRERYKEIPEKYGPAFAKYFQWITPENEMKWGDNQYIRGADNYYKADGLLEFAQENDIKVRGHNLFWNEHMQWMPDWIDSIAYFANTTDQTYFDTGMAIINQRTDECLEYFKGKCAHWDIINEITHGQTDTIRLDSDNFVALGGNYGNLKALTNQNEIDIFEHILKRSREVEPNALFCLNDYNLVTQYTNTRDNFISMVNDLVSRGCDVDIIGCEGHFGGHFEKNELKTKIDYIANGISTGEIWLTEVDFTASDPANWIEGIMDVCFEHERVGGICLWTPWEGNRWRENLNSFVLDTNLNETPMGAKWLEKIQGWTTNTTETTDNDGKLSVNGVHGKYVISFEKDGITYDTTVYLEPGSSPLNIEINLDGTGVSKKTLSKSFANRTILVNNSKIAFNLPVTEKGQLFVKAYSISGKLLAKMPISFNNGVSKIEKMPKGCHIYRIGTESNNYHTVRGLNIH